ncbi:hypothetical protein R6Q57_009098 [Mikania cordata]
MYKTSLSELISIINSYDMDDKQRALNHASSMGIASVLENSALLSAINLQALGMQHYKTPSSQSIPFETAFLSFGQAGSSVHAYEFPTKPVLLTVDPIVSDVSYVSEVSVEMLSITGSEEKEGERSAGRSTDCSTPTSQLSFVPKTDFVEKFDEIKIKPNDMLKSFEKTFAINRVSKLTSSHLTK